MEGQLGISGKWTHKITGASINVRDSIIDGDQMIIISDRGQIDMNEFSQFYIQTSDEIYDESGQVIDTKPVDKNELYYFNNSNNSLPQIETQNTPVLETKNSHQPSQEINIKQNSGEEKSAINHFDLIDKLFKKKNYQPVISINIDKNGCPINELQMIKDIYDISESDISKYFIYEYIKPECINEAVNAFVRQWFSENSE